MFHLNVWLTANDPNDVSKLRDLLARCGAGSRAEEGCELFHVYHSETDPTRFLLVEHWTTKEDWERHRTRQTVTEIYVPQVLPLVKREAHVCWML